jgi:CheY-like chemotaxis protein
VQPEELIESNMDQTALMHSAERPGERDRDAQELQGLQRSAKQSIELHTAGILKHQRHAVIVARQRDWPRAVQSASSSTLSAYSCSSRSTQPREPSFAAASRIGVKPFPEPRQRMEQLINDLMYFSRLGRADLAMQQTDPNAVIVKIPQMMEAVLSERRARIVVPRTVPRIVFAVVMCSTSTYQEDISRAKDLGASGYLTKPPDFSRLRSILQKSATLEISEVGDTLHLLRTAGARDSLSLNDA